ncbi:MAG: NADH-quinone oxidoreductase subunit NuoK [Planctomycetia bacterium]|nr:MAG: NADH-quinone oxidoreductase subunit NuoK [Planctomycetia bacterium]
MLIPLVLVGAALFALGLIGFVTRRNLIIIFLCTELMFQGIVLNLAAFGRYPLSGSPTLDGQAFAIFLLAIAASEAALGLALVVLLYRYRGTLDANAYKVLKDS